jgi:hypothetical protein
MIPVIVIVPDELLDMPDALLAVPPNALDAIVNDCPIISVDTIQDTFPATIPVPVQVTVIPFVGTKEPP